MNWVGFDWSSNSLHLRNLQSSPAIWGCIPYLECIKEKNTLLALRQWRILQHSATSESLSLLDVSSPLWSLPDVLGTGQKRTPSPCAQPTTLLHSSGQTLARKKKKRQTCFQYFWLLSHGSVSQMTKNCGFLKKKKKKENRRILPLKNPATRIQMGFMVSFSQNHLARKDGNWDYIMCATKLIF